MVQNVPLPRQASIGPRGPHDPPGDAGSDWLRSAGTIITDCPTHQLNFESRKEKAQPADTTVDTSLRDERSNSRKPRSDRLTGRVFYAPDALAYRIKRRYRPRSFTTGMVFRFQISGGLVEHAAERQPLSRFNAQKLFGAPINKNRHQHPFFIQSDASHDVGCRTKGLNLIDYGVFRRGPVRHAFLPSTPMDDRLLHRQ
jgi:hypothetical protein